MQLPIHLRNPYYWIFCFQYYTCTVHDTVLQCAHHIKWFAVLYKHLQLLFNTFFLRLGFFASWTAAECVPHGTIFPFPPNTVASGSPWPFDFYWLWAVACDYGVRLCPTSIVGWAPWHAHVTGRVVWSRYGLPSASTGSNAFFQSHLSCSGPNFWKPWPIQTSFLVRTGTSS